MADQTPPHKKSHIEHEVVPVLDFGSQTAQLICRRVRDAGVFSVLVAPSITAEELKAMNPKGIILSGGPSSVTDDNAPTMDPAILELGIPFSDPIADGPTIQKADIRALAAGMTTKRALEFIKKVTDYKPVPIGLLVYYNLVWQYGIEKFFADFKAAGGSSVLIADLSIDDEHEIAPQAKSAGLETVFEDHIPRPHRHCERHHQNRHTQNSHL